MRPESSPRPQSSGSSSGGVPPRGPRPVPGRGGGSPRRFRTVMAVVSVVGIFGLMALRGIAGFYTDFLWFDQLGHDDVFTSVLGAQVVLVVLFTALFFVLVYGNLTVAERMAPAVRPP
ncbi:MAG: COG1615 family transporter, partial [Actinobacteria bacterium]|nr:COG1615 family transporter [Actinomycetota bacterium]